MLFSGYIWNKTEIKLKQNSFTETKLAFVLFQYCFSFISIITTALDKCAETAASLEFNAGKCHCIAAGIMYTVFGKRCDFIFYHNFAKS